MELVLENNALSTKNLAQIRKEILSSVNNYQDDTENNRRKQYKIVVSHILDEIRRQNNDLSEPQFSIIAAEVNEQAKNIEVDILTNQRKSASIRKILGRTGALIVFFMTIATVLTSFGNDVNYTFGGFAALLLVFSLVCRCYSHFTYFRDLMIPALFGAVMLFAIPIANAALPDEQNLGVGGETDGSVNDNVERPSPKLGDSINQDRPEIVGEKPENDGPQDRQVIGLGDTLDPFATPPGYDPADRLPGHFSTLVVGQKGGNSLDGVLSLGRDQAGLTFEQLLAGSRSQSFTKGVAEIKGSFGVLKVLASGTYSYELEDLEGAGRVEEFFILMNEGSRKYFSRIEITLASVQLAGTIGGDSIVGNEQNNMIFGIAGNDWLYGMGGSDTIYGGEGNDTLNGGADHDIVYGEPGNDLITGREGNDIVYAGDGNDDIFGDGGIKDTYAGDDTLHGQNGDDYIYGAAGVDVISGGAGRDEIFGGLGADILSGGSGADVIYGGEGGADKADSDDQIDGNDGDDDLVGQEGGDVLTGGLGSDKFWYFAVGEGIDTITDFSLADGDKLELSNLIPKFEISKHSIETFVFAQTRNGNTEISVNVAGTGQEGAVLIVKLAEVEVSVAELMSRGAIVH